MTRHRRGIPKPPVDPLDVPLPVSQAREIIQRASAAEKSRHQEVTRIVESRFSMSQQTFSYIMMLITLLAVIGTWIAIRNVEEIIYKEVRTRGLFAREWTRLATYYVAVRWAAIATALSFGLTLAWSRFILAQVLSRGGYYHEQKRPVRLYEMFVWGILFFVCALCIAAAYEYMNRSISLLEKSYEAKDGVYPVEWYDTDTQDGVMSMPHTMFTVFLYSAFGTLGYTMMHVVKAINRGKRFSVASAIDKNVEVVQQWANKPRASWTSTLVIDPYKEEEDADNESNKDGRIDIENEFEKGGSDQPRRPRRSRRM